MSNRILVVDDNSAIRGVVRVAIETQSDLEVCGEATDGADGIRKAKQLCPDLIILDLLMPVMNGFQAAHILKKDMPTVPIILFTAQARLSGSRSSDAGISAVVSKTDDIDTLIRQVRALLKPSKGHHQANERELHEQ
jgi:two-component system, NarL family, nitrate/nitrite response regulator NarL